MDLELNQVSTERKRVQGKEGQMRDDDLQKRSLL
jgi:hypothetical protein